MEDFIGILLITLFMEIFFWGFIYGTGYLLTPIITLGKWLPDRLIKHEDTGKIIKKQSGVQLIHRSGKTYLGAWGVLLIGFGFWLTVLMLSIFI
jgi:hypothetical protein